MSWPQSPPLLLASNWTIMDNAYEVVPRKLTISYGAKMIVGSGAILKIV